MDAAEPHIPVLIDPLIALARPVHGRWLDGTFGAGGYARALLSAGADEVIGVDRDPDVHARAAAWAASEPRLSLFEGTFSDLDQHGQELEGVVLDLGVSSMQLDQAERGFSFSHDGPLDMRMGQSGPSAADLIAEASEALIADILFHYGEERASRRIAKAIVRARGDGPILRTGRLAEIISSCLPRPKPGQSHPATRSFQALRIAVNHEYDELAQGLLAAERALKPGGLLAVVTFHSIEDRMVKRFFQARAQAQRANRYAPDVKAAAQFEPVTRKAIVADAQELARNPRARSAKLRAARRTCAAPTPLEPSALGHPQLNRKHR
ncbi:MAG: 16S rRNA (cytosine(1402)-N(4))-methyltransferase RsmH [Pseudomonadota bacterium]